MVLLEMDKDKLKIENGRLIDQLRSTGNVANSEFINAMERTNTIFAKRDLNKYNNRMSAAVGVPGVNPLMLNSKSHVTGMKSKFSIMKKQSGPDEMGDLLAKGPLDMNKLLEMEKERNNSSAATGGVSF